MELDFNKEIEELNNKAALEYKNEQQKEFSLIGSIRRIRGLELYEFDIKELILKKVKIEKSKTANFDDLNSVNDKAEFNQNALYFQCHNDKKAIKKANKIIFDASGLNYYIKEIK